MKHLLLATVAGLFAAAGVHAAGPVGYSAIFATDGVTGTAFAGDGAFPANGSYYQTNTAHWQGTGEAITYTFDQDYQLSSLTISVDHNDFYRVSISKDGSTWQDYATILAFEGSSNDGMDTFSPSVPATADGYRYARVVALFGDSFYSVGELQFTGTAVSPVPEASTVAMMLAGLGVLGGALRRRQPR